MGTQKFREEKGAHDIPLVFALNVPLIAQNILFCNVIGDFITRKMLSTIVRPRQTIFKSIIYLLNKRGGKDRVMGA